MKCFWLLALLLLAGCSSFNRDWKRAALDPQPADHLAGRWEGFWISERNGHNGNLRCLITPAAGDTYDARFRAKYWKILSFGYSVPLTVQRTNGLCRFNGQADLGKLVGVYQYNGAVAGTNFHSTYRSKNDHGYFRMNRVP